MIGSSIAGTLDYAAPEQMGRRPEPVGPYSDVYGWARTCCHALFGTTQPLIVGHNPGLEQLITELTLNDGRGLRERVAGKFPTGALAIIELPAKRWAEVEPGSGEIVELILPKELD